MHKISLGNHVKCWISCHTLYPEKQRNIVIWKSLPDNLNPPSHCCCWQNHNSKGSKTNFNFVINYLAHEFPMNEIKVLQELHSLPLPGYIAIILWSILSDCFLLKSGSSWGKMHDIKFSVNTAAPKPHPWACSRPIVSCPMLVPQRVLFL